MALHIYIHDAWEPKPLPKGVFKWNVTYAIHGDESKIGNLVVKAKNESDAKSEFYKSARGHDKVMRIEKLG